MIKTRPVAILARPPITGPTRRCLICRSRTPAAEQRYRHGERPSVARVVCRACEVLRLARLGVTVVDQPTLAEGMGAPMT